ncbi:60S ribosomal protein L2 [Striga asiatica]|uniref:60S ribosomal protein L2 n=1 Tax=Striga asiatica TaxID=4170 RepID=A0A5A7RH55_STRAF|nr:60S ribosomal protein L2 [Striga asiatica]
MTRETKFEPEQFVFLNTDSQAYISLKRRREVNIELTIKRNITKLRERGEREGREREREREREIPETKRLVEGSAGGALSTVALGRSKGKLEKEEYKPLNPLPIRKLAEIAAAVAAALIAISRFLQLASVVARATNSDQVPTPPPSLVCLGSSGGSLTSETTCPPGGNETHLLPWRRITAHSAGMANVLVVTTTMRMLNRAFPAFSIGFSVRPPPATWPTMARQPLGTIFFAPDGSFTLHTPKNNTSRTPKNKTSRDRLPSSVIIGVVGDNNSVITRSPSENSTITHMMLDVADDGTLGNRSERQDISND